uniref:Kinesin-like protein n=1 Tax=Trypanosoma congolense (strain IL3000) TaxID=1068625 RepID=G0V0A0_TRYCI|nr:putative MCAK-like kinesin [Trypanosoma congolense IL3000]
MTGHGAIATSSITVAARKRPLPSTNDTSVKDVVLCESATTISVCEHKTRPDFTPIIEPSTFTLDHVFDDSATNRDVYERCCQPLLDGVRAGGKAVVIAFGQTGSGKTHTLLGHGNKAVGLCAYTVRELIACEPDCELVVSFYETYGSRLFDLLNARAELKILQDDSDNVHIVGLSESVVTTEKQLCKLVSKGETLRSSGKTPANDASSRSHAVLRISIRCTEETNVSARGGRVTFVDLAGSEKVKDTMSSDTKARHEGAEINKALLALKECIRAISLNKRHIPFRASKLTQVLRESFVGSCKTCIIATISPSQRSCEETLSTLRYANRISELRSSGNEDTCYKVPMSCPNCMGSVYPDKSHTCVRLCTRCPHCKQAVDKQDLQLHIAGCSEFPVRCQRCNELLVRGELSRHNRRCSRSLVRCPACTCHVMRCSLEKHMLLDCGAKREKCRYCSHPFPRHSLSRHEAVCNMMKIACPYCLQYFRKSCVDAHATVCVRNPLCKQKPLVKPTETPGSSPAFIRDCGERGKPRSSICLPSHTKELLRAKSSIQLRESRRCLQPLNKNTLLPPIDLFATPLTCEGEGICAEENAGRASCSGSRSGSATGGCGATDAVGQDGKCDGSKSSSGRQGLCPYSSYGCECNVSNSALQQHMAEAMADHLQLVCDYAKRVEKENCMLRQRAVAGNGKESENN